MRDAHCEYALHAAPVANQGVQMPALQKLPLRQSMSPVQFSLQSTLLALQT
jgi:hypothetical protein